MDGHAVADRARADGFNGASRDTRDRSTREDVAIHVAIDGELRDGLRAADQTGGEHARGAIQRSDDIAVNGEADAKLRTSGNRDAGQFRALYDIVVVGVVVSNHHRWIFPYDG